MILRDTPPRLIPADARFKPNKSAIRQGQIDQTTVRIRADYAIVKICKIEVCRLESSSELFELAVVVTGSVADVQVALGALLGVFC